MSEQRLIDANEFVKEAKPLTAVPIERIKNAPTIDPETLPIVKQLRNDVEGMRSNWCKASETVHQQREELERRDMVILELENQLEKITSERNAAIRDLKCTVEMTEGCMFCKHENDLDYDGCGRSGCWEWKGCQTAIEMDNASCESCKHFDDFMGLCENPVTQAKCGKLKNEYEPQNSKQMLSEDYLKEMIGRPIWLETQKRKEWVLLWGFHGPEVYGRCFIFTRRTGEKVQLKFSEIGREWKPYKLEDKNDG